MVVKSRLHLHVHARYNYMYVRIHTPGGSAREIVRDARGRNGVSRREASGMQNRPEVLVNIARYTARFRKIAYSHRARKRARNGAL